jgi:enoyl-CoA hydratase/carnithine racemase
MTLGASRRLDLPTELLRAHVDGAVGWITLDNPAKRNAMTLAMWEAMTQAIGVFAADPRVRAIVLCGAGGRAFCSGADIGEMERMAAEGRQAAYAAVTDAARRALAAFEKPLLAMIRGSCIGGGLSLALQADVRVASSDSTFGMPTARVGLAPDAGNLARVTALLGPGATKELMFTGDVFGAERALALGLVNRVAEPDELEAETAALVGRIAANAPLVLRAIKRGVDMFAGDDKQRAPALFDELSRMCADSEDLREGRRAFMEKRAPIFSGR